MAQIGKWAVMFIGALVLSAISQVTKSTYLTEFFSKDALLLGGAIFTIHAAAVGILVGQLSLLSGEGKFNFSKTISGIKFSLIEAMICLVIIVICAIIQYSDLGNEWNKDFFINKYYICSIFQVFCIGDMIYIIYDAINAILISSESLKPSKKDS